MGSPTWSNYRRLRPSTRQHPTLPPPRDFEVRQRRSRSLPRSSLTFSSSCSEPTAQPLQLSSRWQVQLLQHRQSRQTWISDQHARPLGQLHPLARRVVLLQHGRDGSRQSKLRTPSTTTDADAATSPPSNAHSSAALVLLPRLPSPSRPLPTRRLAQLRPSRQHVVLSHLQPLRVAVPFSRLCSVAAVVPSTVVLLLDSCHQLASCTRRINLGVLWWKHVATLDSSRLWRHFTRRRGVPTPASATSSQSQHGSQWLCGCLPGCPLPHLQLCAAHVLVFPVAPHLTRPLLPLLRTDESSVPAPDARHHVLLLRRLVPVCRMSSTRSHVSQATRCRR